MTAKVLLSLATGSTFASVLLSPVMATPATVADLEGRKICWDGGNISSFMPEENIQARRLVTGLGP